MAIVCYCNFVLPTQLQLALKNTMSELNLAQNTHSSCALQLDKANRHGLTTGATGTGKTVTLQKLAEEFSAVGVLFFWLISKGI